jgi:hypothetical protein
MILGRAALASETDRTINTWVPKSAHPLFIERLITNEEQRSREVKAPPSQKQTTSVEGSMCVIESRGSCGRLLDRAALASETGGTRNTCVPNHERPLTDVKLLTDEEERSHEVKAPGYQYYGV